MVSTRYRNDGYIWTNSESDIELFQICYNRLLGEFNYYHINKSNSHESWISREEFKQILAIRKTALWKTVYEGS